MSPFEDSYNDVSIAPQNILAETLPIDTREGAVCCVDWAVRNEHVIGAPKVRLQLGRL